MPIELPIDKSLPHICETIRENAVTVLTATPGAGKTTRLPPELLSVVEGQVWVLQPRRMAAVAAANRIAEERGWKLGEEVGYQVRFDSRVSARTRLIFLTDALALRHMLENSDLIGVGLIVLDEFHERNLHQDIILGLVRELQEMGAPLKLLIMSATLATDTLLRFIPEAVQIDIPGKIFPLEIEYGARATQVRLDRDFYAQIADLISVAEKRTDGDILVFLPGVGELKRTQESVRTRREVHLLHGSLPLDEQQSVLRGGQSPRIILATNVAEASVTVEGVDCVVDSGFSKLLFTDPQTGFSQLKLSRISLFNARQRAGRAARQKPGVCFRMWTEFEESTMPQQLPSECQRVDLTQTLLTLAHFGVTRFETFSWLDHPPGPLISMAQRLLRYIGALDGQNHLMEYGRRLLAFPVPPRWGSLLAAGEDARLGTLAATMCALLNERDSQDFKSVTTKLECDLSLRMEILRDYKGRNKQVMQVVRQLEGLLNKSSLGDIGPDWTTELRHLLLKTQSEFLCRRRGQGLTARRVGGRGVRLAESSQVQKSEFFVALEGIDLPGQADTLITVACGIDKATVLKVLGDQIEVREEIVYIEEKERFFSQRSRYFRDLAVDEPSLVPVAPDQVSQQLADLVHKNWDKLVVQHEALKAWNSRREFLARYDVKADQILDETTLRQFAEVAAFNKTSWQEVLNQDLVAVLEGQLPREIILDLEKNLPSHFVAPTGSRFPIHYETSGSAYVEVRIQEMFGTSVHPKIARGQLPLTFRLLGPNYRPMQVTSDIVGFWQTSYLEIRKELRARYPMHSWPEDPLNAKPEAKGKRR